MKKILMIALALALVLCGASLVMAANHPCEKCGGETNMLASSSASCSWYCAACEHNTVRSHDPNSIYSDLLPDSCSGTCRYCGTPAVFSSHTFTQYKFNHDSTCTEDGTETARCDNTACSATHTRTAEGSALGHDNAVKVIYPTCEEGGYSIFTCRRCGFVSEGDFTNPMGHAYGTWTPNHDGTHSAPCTRVGCQHVGKGNCTPVKIVMGGKTFLVCSVCGDSTLVDLEVEEDATIEPDTGVTLPRGRLIVMVDPAPFEEPIVSPALYLITASLQFSGQEVPLKGRVNITVNLADDPFVVTHEKLANIPVTELTAEDVKVVRLEVISGLEAWEELTFTLEEGVLTFKTDKLGAFLMVPADAVSPYEAANVQ